MSGPGSDSGWLEAAIAWEVCASLHRQYCKGKDALFTTRQSDFVKHAENARGRAPPAQKARMPLSDEQIFKAYTTATGKKLLKQGPERPRLLQIFRLAEAAHGIKGKEVGNAE